MRFLVWLVTGIVERDFWLRLIGVKKGPCSPRERRCSRLGESFGDDLKRWWLQLWWPLIERYKLNEIPKEFARAQITTDSEEPQ